MSRHCPLAYLPAPLPARTSQAPERDQGEDHEQEHDAHAGGVQARSGHDAEVSHEAGHGPRPPGCGAFIGGTMLPGPLHHAPWPPAPCSLAPCTMRWAHSQLAHELHRAGRGSWLACQGAHPRPGSCTNMSDGHMGHTQAQICDAGRHLAHDCSKPSSSNWVEMLLRRSSASCMAMHHRIHILHVMHRLSCPLIPFSPRATHVTPVLCPLALLEQCPKSPAHTSPKRPTHTLSSCKW